MEKNGVSGTGSEYTCEDDTSSQGREMGEIHICRVEKIVHNSYRTDVAVTPDLIYFPSAEVDSLLISHPTKLEELFDFSIGLLPCKLPRTSPFETLVDGVAFRLCWFWVNIPL